MKSNRTNEKLHIPLTQEIIDDIKNHMGILVEGLRDEVRLIRHQVWMNGQSLKRIEMKLERTIINIQRKNLI